MEKQPEYEKQLSEIHEIITESRSRFTGGGPAALVWGILTVLAIAVQALVPNLGDWSMYLWAAHNALGWAITLVLYNRVTEIRGRRTLRERYTMRAWAALTMAVWISLALVRTSASSPWTLYAGLVTLLVGVGIVVTGLIAESRLSQIMGAAAMLIGPGLAMLAPESLAQALAYGSMVVISIAWGIGSWVARER